MVEFKVLAAIVLELAGEQALDDVERFGEKLLALAAARPAGADDVLVQPLACT
ncbi:MAG TPA: hypothetical protein VGG11_11620 [Xanthobacteraceae bacterium]|jgi:hypothetical protein